MIMNYYTKTIANCQYGFTQLFKFYTEINFSYSLFSLIIAYAHKNILNNIYQERCYGEIGSLVALTLYAGIYFICNTFLDRNGRYGDLFFKLQ